MTDTDRVGTIIESDVEANRTEANRAEREAFDAADKIIRGSEAAVRLYRERCEFYKGVAYGLAAALYITLVICYVTKDRI